MAGFVFGLSNWSALTSNCFWLLTRPSETGSELPLSSHLKSVWVSFKVLCPSSTLVLSRSSSTLVLSSEPHRYSESRRPTFTLTASYSPLLASLSLSTPSRVSLATFRHFEVPTLRHSNCVSCGLVSLWLLDRICKIVDRLNPLIYK